jgi:hypothetical protein
MKEKQKTDKAVTPMRKAVNSQLLQMKKKSNIICDREGKEYNSS